MSAHTVSGCFYLDSCVVLSEMLGDNAQRMAKLRDDVNTFGINCYISQSVINEISNKIRKTTDFLGNILKDVIVKYLEGIRTKPRDLYSAYPSNADLHTLKDAFLAVNWTARTFDLITDPFQAIEEWIVKTIDDEFTKGGKRSLADIVLLLTATIIQEMNKLESDFERIVELEMEYIQQSNQMPVSSVANVLIKNGIHQPDADHISVVESHRKNHGEPSVFLTFDYKTIILRWFSIQKKTGIIVCDPIYGLSHLR